MNFSEFMFQRLRNGNFDSLLFYGEGGIGKTTALVDFSIKLHKCINNEKFAEKWIIPYYIPFSEVRQKRFAKGTELRNYIWRTAFPTDEHPNENNIDDKLVAEETDRLFEDPDGIYQYMLLCDGINEIEINKELKDELESLICKRNVTVCITSRYPEGINKDCFKNIEANMVKAWPLDDAFVWDKIKECGVDPSRIKEESEDLWNILKIPFYLDKWIKLAKNNFNNVLYNSKGELLGKYYDWIKERNVEANIGITYAEGNSEEMTHEEVLEAATFFLDSLALKMNEKYLMYVPLVEKNESDKSAWEKTIKSFPKKYLGKLPHKDGKIDKKTLFDRFFIPMGVFEMSGTYDDPSSVSYRFSHQIFRDFMAAMSIFDISREPKWQIDTSILCSTPDVLNLFANRFLSASSLIDESGEFQIPATKIFDSLNLGKKNEKTINDPSNISVIGFIIDNQLEALKNGSLEKTNFCESIKGICSSLSEKISYYVDQDIDHFDLAIYDTVRAITEIQRRSAEYKKAVDALDKLIGWIDKYNGKHASDSDEKFPKAKAGNGLAKCRLLGTYDEAKKNPGFDVNRLEDYEKILEELRVLTEEEHYTPSANLYSMMLATPDAVSMPYIDRIMEAKGISSEQRVVMGFDHYWKAACYNYEVLKSGSDTYKPTDLMNVYPIRQCCAMLVDQKAAFAKNKIVSGLDSFEAMMDKVRYTENEDCKDALVSTLYDDALEEQNDHIIDLLFSYLENRHLKEVNSIQVKYMIRKGAPEEAIREKMQSCRSEFVCKLASAYLSDQDDIEAIEKLLSFLKERCMNRTPDSYDGIYMQRDLERIWHYLQANYPKKHSAEFLEAVNGLVSDPLS